MIPPGGTTHGSAKPYVGGEIFPLETLRRAQGTEFKRIYDTIPAITPYAILGWRWVENRFHQSPQINQLKGRKLNLYDNGVTMMVRNAGTESPM